jgi:hypothetical protein
VHITKHLLLALSDKNEVGGDLSAVVRSYHRVAQREMYSSAVFLALYSSWKFVGLSVAVRVFAHIVKDLVVIEWATAKMGLILPLQYGVHLLKINKLTVLLVPCSL